MCAPRLGVSSLLEVRVDQSSQAIGGGATLDVLDIGNPVAFSSREARISSFAIKARRRPTKERWLNPFERVDAHNRIEIVLDAARDDWDYAAAGAGMELRGFGAKGVFGHERRILNYHLQCSAWIGCPYATVLDAERAGAEMFPQ